MQDFILTAINAAEKHTLVLSFIKNYDKDDEG